MTKLLVLDFEGTSRLASARATEIGCVQLNPKLDTICEFETLINPPVPVESSALSVSRLSKKELANAPIFSEVWPQFATLLSDTVVVAHNKIYETNVLKNELGNIKVRELPPMICTLEWSRKTLGHKVPDHTLGTLCSYFDIELIDAHEALGDARATAQLFRELWNLNPDLKRAVNDLSQNLVSYKIEKVNSVTLATRERFRSQVGDKSAIKIAENRILKQNKTLVVITGTPDDGKEAFGEYLNEAGLEYRETPPTKGTAFVVQSNNSPGMSKIRKAIELDIPVLSEEDCLTLLRKLRG